MRTKIDLLGQEKCLPARCHHCDELVKASGVGGDMHDQCAAPYIKKLETLVSSLSAKVHADDGSIFSQARAMSEQAKLLNRIAVLEEENAKPKEQITQDEPDLTVAYLAGYHRRDKVIEQLEAALNVMCRHAAETHSAEGKGLFYRYIDKPEWWKWYALQEVDARKTAPLSTAATESQTE